MVYIHMSFSAVTGKARPALAMKLTLTLGLVMLAVGVIFSAIYFVLSVSLFSRLANQQLEQKAKSAEVVVRAVANSKDTINSKTFIRKLQAAGISDHIGVYSEAKRLIDHTDDTVQSALSRYATDPKLRLREVEQQNRLLGDALNYLRSRPTSPLYLLDDIHYTSFVQDQYTILVGLTAQKPKMLTLAASFFLLCLLAAGINTLFVYHYGHSLAHTIAQIVRGLDVDSIHVDSINPQYEEVEALIFAVDEKIRQSRVPQQHTSAAVTIAATGGGDATLQLMQTKLFEKPFPRMLSYEVAVYPRYPKIGTKEFICGAHDQGRIDVLIGVTDSDTAEALIVKHRIQERFGVLAKENLASDELARNLWTAFFTHSELVPGLFFARLDENEKSMDIYRAGGVHLFEIIGDDCREIHLGSEQFGSEYTMVSEHRLTAGSHFVMVSHDAFSAMELSTGDFAELLGRLGSAKTGKHLLAGILEKIHQKLEAGEVVPGLLAVLSEKK
jgi:hypothetical protein